MGTKAFITCLNSEAKIYNFPVAGVVLCIGCLVVAGLIKGLMWALGAGALGFVLGSWLSREWHGGNLQRKMYWYLPWQKVFVHKNLPESHYRNLIDLLHNQRLY